MSTAFHSRARWSRHIRHIALAAACLSTALTSVAFAPGGGVHVYPASKTHGEITEDALGSVYTSAGLTTITNSMKAARKQFVEANKAVDGDQKSSAKHFDGEIFRAGSNG